MERIKGLIDAPFTPFYENGEVNLEPIEAYAKMLVKNGLQGVFINGSSGEGYMLTEEERMRLAERWVSVAPEGFKVIVRVPNFAGIKYTFESMYEYNQCRLYKNGKFDMLHGQDETILPCLAMGGAQGGIGGTTNYNGKELVGIIEAWEAGDIETARERQNFSQEVINVICHFRGNIVGGKRIMKLIGLDLGKNRTPFQNMTDEEEAQMKAELEAIHFFDRCNKF